MYVYICKEIINFQFNTVFEYNERFRLSAIEVEEILFDIGYRLEHPTNSSKALSAKHQLVTTLHWLRNGCQYHGIADMHTMAKSCVYRSIRSVVTIINQIKFPQVVCLSQEFYNATRMTQVVGCTDGTLIDIDAPNENEAQYVDRHGKQLYGCMWSRYEILLCQRKLGWQCS